MQFILLNEDCVVLDSDQILFSTTIGDSIVTAHPFFESLPDIVTTIENALDFTCIHITVNNTSLIVDLKLLKKEAYFLLVLFDMTEHYNSLQTVTQSRNESVIKTELTVIKNRELQERERFKNRFIQNFSHELRNPLTGIMAIIEILQDTEITEEQHKMLDFLKESSANLRLMLEDTLSIGMIDAGKLKIQCKLFNLHRFFELLRFTYQTKAQKKGLKFKCAWDASIPEFVEGDRLRVFQIVTNLLDNAIKFTEEGTVSLLAKLNQKRANKVNVRFEVQDTGPGIKEEDQHSIFESFRQLQTSDNRGAGLGLTIVERLLELMHSKIQLKSTVGQGSLFYFDMNLKYPLLGESKQVKHSEKKVIRGPKKDQKKYKVLLVEDDAYVQTTLFKILLNTNTFQIDLAYDGALVMQEVVNNNYDIILMDVDLPNINGIQLTKLIKEFPFKNIQKIPIIGITANAYQESIDQCLAAGMNTVLPKPFGKDELVETILKVIK